MRRPQPSAMGPQLAFSSSQVLGVQFWMPPPQTFGCPPPPQTAPTAVHSPHSMSPPQPSAMGPQFAPAASHVRGVQCMPVSAGPESETAPSPSPESVPTGGRSDPQPAAISAKEISPLAGHAVLSLRDLAGWEEEVAIIGRRFMANVRKLASGPGAVDLGA